MSVGSMGLVKDVWIASALCSIWRAMSACAQAGRNCRAVASVRGWGIASRCVAMTKRNPPAQRKARKGHIQAISNSHRNCRRYCQSSMCGLWPMLVLQLGVGCTPERSPAPSRTPATATRTASFSFRKVQVNLACQNKFARNAAHHASRLWPMATAGSGRHRL